MLGRTDNFFASLPPDATPGKVKELYRELSRSHHPDLGGSAETFARLNDEYRTRLAAAERPRMCPECSGLGRIIIHSGVSGLPMLCQMCGGRGEIEVRE